MEIKEKYNVETNAIAGSRQPVVTIEKLNKSFGDNHVLRNFDLNLYKGENVVVLGKSGSGKSVLIKCLVGLMPPDSGRVNIFGTDVTKLDHIELDKLRMRVGFLFQSNALYDSMTVRENLEFPLRRHKIHLTKKEVNDKVAEALGNVGLEYTTEMMPAELSGGMKKRIALARTLILKPEIILYDEPTTGLDPVTAREISRLILEVQEKYNTSSIIISHDMNCVRIVANRIVVLINGGCFANDTYEQLKRSEEKEVKQFFE